MAGPGIQDDLLAQRVGSRAADGIWRSQILAKQSGWHPKRLAANLRAYINGFSDNMREIVERFDFDNTISTLDDAGLLFLVLERFKNIDLHPDKVSNLEMGYIFEELICKLNEAINENPGEH